MRAARVLVIGGGVIGLSAAYHLSLRGAAEVILLEKDICGAGSSSRAPGSSRACCGARQVSSRGSEA